MRLRVAAAAEGWTFVHAGVLGWRGRALLVPGRSRSGKTTLVAELVRAGADYYSDELALLDGGGRVHPFAKRLSIREGFRDGREVLSRPSAEEIGGRAGTEPLPVGLVVLAEHHPGATWNPVRLTPGQGLLRMIAHTVPVRLRPEASLHALERVVLQAPVLAGVRGEARDAARGILDALDAGGVGVSATAGEEGTP
jgi:hypothetical protein